MSQSDNIPEPFDEIPTVAEPDADDRRVASLLYPPRAVPDEGPIPDPHHSVNTQVGDVETPDWAIEAAIWRLEQNEEEVTELDVKEMLQEHAMPRHGFVTPDGQDAVERVLEEVND